MRELIDEVSKPKFKVTVAIEINVHASNEEEAKALALGIPIDKLVYPVGLDRCKSIRTRPVTVERIK
jgi:hypothetical protein